MKEECLLNPYIVGLAVDAPNMFFGREDVFEFLHEHLPGRYQNNVVILEGQTRVGKTSVLLQMDRHMHETHVPVLVDLQAMTQCDLESLLAEIIYRINSTFAAKKIAFQEPERPLGGTDICDYFRQRYLPAVSAAIGGLNLLLMFDETPLLFELGLEREADDILRYIHHLMQFFPQVDFLFTAGSAPNPEWEVKFSHYFGTALRKDIGFLERADAISLITQPVANALIYSDAAIEEILALTSGHPYYVQLICHCLFNACLEKQACHVDADAVELVIDDALEMGGLNLEDIWNRSNEAEKIVLALLASTMQKYAKRSLTAEEYQARGRFFGWDVHTPSLQTALEHLKKRHVISPAEPYRFRVDLFRHWFLQHDKTDLLRQHADLDSIRQDYLDYVREACGWLDFRGIMQVQKSMLQPLMDVFVPLHVVSEKWSDVILEEFTRHARVKKLLQELQDPSMAQPQLQQAMKEELELLSAISQQEQPKVCFNDMLKDALRLVVLGDPGSGKTTLLKYLALVYSLGRQAVREHLGLDEERLPILVSLGAYASALREYPDQPLKSFLPEYLLEANPNLPPQLSWLLQDELQAGRCILLLDGLDEAANASERKLITERVRELAQIHPGNRLVVTSRIIGYEEAPLGEEYAHCTLGGLELPDIKQFAQKWSRAYERQQGDSPLIERQADIEAARLYEAIQQNPNVRQLAENPLLLTIIALIHRKGTKLPNHRIELYALCVKTLIETWRNVRAVSLDSTDSQIDEKEAIKIFAPIALWMHEEKPIGTVSSQELEDKIADLLKQRYVPPEEASSEAKRFLRMEERLIGLLVKRGRDAYSFSHRTFQEYFAARAIAMNRDRNLGKLREHRHDPLWSEVILLTIGQFGIIQTEEDTATRLVQEFFDKPSFLDDVLHRDLLLAGRCLADDVGISRPLQKKILTDLLKLWPATPFEWLKAQIADTLASMRLAVVEHDVVQALIENLDHPEENIRAMAAEVLGKMGQVSSEVIPHLLRPLHDVRPRVRSSVAQAIGQIGVVMPAVIEQLDGVLKHDDDLDVRRSAAHALVKLGEENDEALKLTLAALHFPTDPQVRSSAAAALAHLKHADDRVITSLIAALGDARLDVRFLTAEALGKLGRDSGVVIPALLGLLKDPKTEARMSAAAALGELEATNEAAIRALTECLNDDDYGVRRNTIQVLGKLGRRSENVVSILSQALTDGNARTRVGAANALGLAGRAGEEVLAKVHRQLGQGGDWQDQLSTVEAVVSVDVKGDTGMLVTDNLLQLLTPDFRHMGWDALGIVASLFGEVAKRNAQVVANLIEHLAPDKPRLVRVCVAEALGMAGQTDQLVLDALVEALSDDMDFVRGNAAQALGRLGKTDERITTQLLKALDDSIPGVQLSAAEALGKLGDRSSRVVEALRSKLDDEGYSFYHRKYVRDAVFEALQILAPYGTIP